MPTIHGIVTKEGDKLGGAYVRCIGPSGEFVAEIYTGDGGAFAFHVAEGTWRLETRAAGVATDAREVVLDEADAYVAVEL